MRRVTLTRVRQLEMYRRMQRIRQFEEALDATSVRGHLSIGQEAAIVGACMALCDTDYITGTNSAPPPAIGARPGEPRQVSVQFRITR